MLAAGAGRITALHDFTEIVLYRIVKIFMARDNDLFGLVLVTLSFYPLQLAVCINQTFRNGKIPRVELILVVFDFTVRCSAGTGRLQH